jgi:phenylacetate-coenzyme A ligase PaaK-like adenylate-forming protein
MNLLTRMYWSAYLAYHLRGQPQYPFKPLADIRRDQARRVRRMVAYAYRHVPYYRETMDRLSLRPADFQVADDLAKLPVLERCQVQKDPEYFVSRAQPLEHYLRLRSGGSTGAPCTIYQDPGALFQNRARGERADRGRVRPHLWPGHHHRHLFRGFDSPHGGRQGAAGALHAPAVGRCRAAGR